MKIAIHTLVKNEVRFVWYSVMSVAPFVDKIYLRDIGSTDGTVEILKKIKKILGKKVDLKIAPIKGRRFFEMDVRQEMLDETNEDWFLVVDGDEIWWDSSIEKIVSLIKSRGNEIEGIVTPTVNLVGDIFHYQEAAAGRYNFFGKTGHFNLRAVNRRIPGLSSFGEHGVWGWVDSERRMIQDRVEKMTYLDAPYLHATFLRRSEERDGDKMVYKRKNKLKYDLGLPFPKDYYYPEIFFRPRPESVSDVWERRSTSYVLRATFETPLRMAKRRLFRGRVGY